jgi:carbon monoxide dehydrogenase subunit G
MMRFSKEIHIPLDPARVWSFLWDVDRVCRCLPGCTDARAIVPYERYEARVSQRVGPFRVEFPLAITVLETVASRRLRAQAAGRDARIGSSLRVTVDLEVEAAAGGSRLLIVTDANIGGKLGALGAGIIQHKADEIMTRFAESIQRELQTAS